MGDTCEDCCCKVYILSIGAGFCDSELQIGISLRYLKHPLQLQILTMIRRINAFTDYDTVSFVLLYIPFVNQASVVSDSEKNYSYCVYDSDISTGYGVGALLFLLLSQVLVMVYSRCFCCGRVLKPGGSRACALILFLFCW